MKIRRQFSSIVLIVLLVFITTSVTSNPVKTAAQAGSVQGWHTGPFPPPTFQYARHDGAFVPGPALASWANKVYFPGGRTSPPTESPNIWMFDPVTLTYSDTGADVVEDVSNYNANLVIDDGTGRGPAIYVIGGTDKDHGGISIGMVQRYYPMTNEAEALGSEDNWNGSVGGSRVAAMGTAVVDDIIYVYGGWETDLAPYFSPETWTFDPNLPAGFRWAKLGTNLSIPRSYIMSAVQGGKVYAIGGVSFYDGAELNPTDRFEVLDTANLAAGWTQLAPLPTAGGEGRGFGFDADTLKIESVVAGKIYVVAANDWPDPSGTFYEYDVASDTWNTTLPNLPTPRADLAGSYIPLCTADPDDGLPGLWTFGGRVNTSCDPPLGPTEYFPVECTSECTSLTAIDIQGPVELAVGVTGTYSASIVPADASAPAHVSWNNGATTPETSYRWDVPGTYSVEVTGNNCDGSAVVTDTLEVTVFQPCTALSGAEIDGPTSLFAGETGMYTVTLTPITATLPISITWNNGVTDTHSSYSWTEAGLQTVEVTAENCGGPVSASLEVEVAAVVPTSFPVWMPLVRK